MAKPLAERGRLFTRGKGGRYYLEFFLNGQRLQKRLLDPDGQPITSLRKAKEARARVLAPYRAEDARQLRKQAVHALQDAEEACIEAEQAAKPKTRLADMWARKPWNTNRRGTNERPLAPRTIRDNQSQWSKFLRWADGAGLEFAEDVTPEHAVAFRDALLADALSGNRVNKVLLCARVVFALSGIEPGPFNAIRPRTHKPQGRREFTEQELARVCRSADGELRTLLAVGLYTGLRLGDACRLEWTEVAPDLSRIVRAPSKTAYTGAELVIPVHTVLAAILAETPEDARIGLVLPKLGALYELNDGSRVSKLIQDHLNGCGIQTHKRGTGGETGKRAVVEVGFHSLRHSFVSLCARQGVPLHVVQSLCGHSSPQVQRLYLHASTGDAERAISSLPSVELERTEADPRRALAELARTLPVECVERLLVHAKREFRDTLNCSF